MLNNNIIILQIRFIDCFVFLLCICFGKINIYRHERTIFLDNLTHTVFVTEFQAFIIQKQCDLSSDCCAVAIFHIIFCTTVAGPVNRCRTFFERKCINVYFIGYHESGIETETKMTDHLVICCLIFIFFKELCCSGKCNLCNVFFYLIGSHTNTIINEFQGLGI